MPEKDININKLDRTTLFQSLVEEIDELMMIFDLEGRIVFANNSTLKALGYKEEDLKGKPISVLFEPTKGKEYLAYFESLISTKSNIGTYEVELRGNGGRTVALEISGKRLYENRNLIGAVAVGRDISTKKDIAYKLAIRLREQSLITDLCKDILLGEDWIELFQKNIEQTYQLLGVGAIALIRLNEENNEFQISSSVGWDDEKINSFNLSLSESGAKGIHPEQSYTLRYDRAKKKTIPPWFTGFPEEIKYSFFVPILQNKRIIGALIVHLKIEDELPENKIGFVEQIASILMLSLSAVNQTGPDNASVNLGDLIPDIVMKINLKGDLLYANPAMFSELKAQGLGKGDWTELLPDIHLKKMRECLEEDKNLKGEAVFGNKTVEYWYIPAEGEDAVLLIGRDVADKDEALGELMMSEAELITSTKEINVLQGRERTMKDQLAYAERLAAIGQMGAKIAHELNNPLQIISARAELIAELDDKEKIRELVVDMQEEIQHIINISVSYMNLGKQSPADMKSLDINNLLTDLLKALGILGHIKYLDVTSNFDDPIPTVYCDREKIVQVFRNLIMNAAHSMEKSDLKSLIITTSYHDETSSIVIEVSDTGTGIKKKDLATIFDPYFTTKEEGVGTGIGLVIVRDVVEIEMGGTIKVESTYGEGTTFTISLPAEV